MNAVIRLGVAAVLTCVWSIAAHAFTITEVTSPGGIKAWLVQEKAIPLIAMNFSFKGGSIYDPAGKEGASEFLTGMMDEGAGDVTSAEFQKKRDELAFRMSFDSGRDFFEGSFQTLSKNRDPSFDLLRLAITSPRFDAEPMERVRQQFLINAADELQDPQSIAWDAWLEQALPGDPYARPEKGSVETIKALSADDLHAAHRRIFTRDTLQVAVVGDISAAELGPLLDKVFGGLPLSNDLKPLPQVTLAQGPKQKLIDRDIPQSVITFGHEGIKRDDKDFFAAYVMGEIFGGGGFTSWLTREIREKRGLTYGVGMSLSPMERTGLFAGSLQTENAKAGEALKLVHEVMKQMAEEGPTQQELDEAKTYLTGSYALRFSSNNAIADVLLSLQQQNLPITYVETRNANIEAVTLDQVKAQARRLLHPDRLIVTIVGKPEGLN